MSGNIHIEGQTTKKYDIPLSHLDYKYIETCKNTKELEKIINVLRTGEEGKFPDLERFAERRLAELNPKSRSLRKDGPILRPGDLSGGDWNSIEEDLKNWSNTMNSQDIPKHQKVTKSSNDIVEDDENLPPVRSGNVILEGKKQKKEDKKTKRVMPRDYKEWEKVDIDAELERVDSAETEKPSQNAKIQITSQIDKTGLTEEERARKADREKDKGNEAFRASDFEESVTYYSRSISLMPNAASFNNRALAYLKLESWDKAIKDCNKVLSFEADNIKALLRRGTAYKSKKDFKKAVTDLEKVLNLEPNNKKAEALLKEAEKENEKEEKARQEKGGRRMVIEEVESDDEDADENIEHVEAEKPYVNGHSVSNESTKTDSGTTKSVLKENNEQVYKESKQDVIGSSDVRKDTPPETTRRISNGCVDSSNASSAGNQPDIQSEVLSAASSKYVDSTSRSALPSSSVLEEVSQPSPSSLSSRLTELESEHNIPTSTDKKSDVLSQTTEPSHPSDNTSTADHFTRPRYIQRVLPSNIQQLKDQGNKLFRSGQYSEAISQYTKAIDQLEKDGNQAVHLSVLLSNRAACNLKIGSCTEAIKDCQFSLQHVPHNLKSLLRRAAAYEAMERYAEAYVDYKHVISIDKLADQAHHGASRCQGSLQNSYGQKTWRDKIPPLVLVQPWEIPFIEDEATMHTSPSSSKPSTETNRAPLKPPAKEESRSVTVSSTSTVTQSQDSYKGPTKASSDPTSKDSQSKSHTQNLDFEQVKAKGNTLVQKGQYEEAVVCYSTCIELKPDQIACYTNRALCYLKLNRADSAVTDCEKALELDPHNAKALYRRALARKANQQYKQCLQDLIELLKLEPKNTAAQKEMNWVKKVYKEELEKLKQKKAAEQDTKVRKRMKIEEVDDDEEDEKPTRGKGSEKSKSQTKSRVSSGAKSKGNNGRGSTTQQQPPVYQTAESDTPMAPPIAPRLMKTTPYEFCQAWNSLKPCQGVQPYAEILRQFSPSDLPSVISNKLDGQMLQIIVKCVHEEMVLKGEIDRGYQILNNLCKVPRFSTVSMFMCSKERKEVSSVLDIMSKSTSSVYSSEDIIQLKSSFSVK